MQLIRMAVGHFEHWRYFAHGSLVDVNLSHDYPALGVEAIDRLVYFSQHPINREKLGHLRCRLARPGRLIDRRIVYAMNIPHQENRASALRTPPRL